MMHSASLDSLAQSQNVQSVLVSGRSLERTLMSEMLCFWLILLLSAVVGSSTNVNLTLEEILLGMKTSPPLTSSDFLATLVSEYGVSIYQQDRDNQTIVNTPTGIMRQYLTQDFHDNQIELKPSLEKVLDPRPASCEPEMRTIHLENAIGAQSSLEPADVYFPHCVRVARCAGCCPSKRLTCSPTHTRQDFVPVVHVRFSPSHRRFIYLGTLHISVSSHLSCSCQCITQASSCRNDQVYQEHSCGCVCPLEARSRCLERQSSLFGGRFLVWNAKECLCQCRPPNRARKCPPGFRFDSHKCSCDRAYSSQADARRFVARIRYA